MNEPERVGQRPYFDAAGHFLGSTNVSKGCQHPPDQREIIGECEQGCCYDHKCHACGGTFRVELPE